MLNVAGVFFCASVVTSQLAMKVVIELSLVAKKKRIRIGGIELIVNVKDAVEIALDDQPEVTQREATVRGYILEGMAHKEIAAKMNISESTAKFHATNLYAKYGVRDRSALIFYLTRNKTEIEDD